MQQDTEVHLQIHAKLNPGLTVAWKAFEKELILNAIKADLVQLNGYYQYPPKLIIETEIPESEEYASVLKSVMSNKEIPVIKDSEALASEWCIPLEDVMQLNI